MESEIMLGKHNATQLAAALALGRAVPAACMVGVPLALCVAGAVTGWQLAALPKGAKVTTIYYFDPAWQPLAVAPTGAICCAAAIGRGATAASTCGVCE